MKIAIVKLSALGDIIHTAFVVQFIKKSIPDIQIDWIVEESFAPILEHNPHIDNILPINLRSLKKSKLNILEQIKLLKSYSKERYDLIIDFQGLIKSAITAKLLGKNIAGFDKNSTRESLASVFYTKSFDIPYDLNTLDRYRTLASKALDIDITKDEVMSKKPYMYYKESDLEISKEYISSTKKSVIFIIGANWRSRIYPKEQLLEVAKNLDANILIPHGNEDEKKRGEWLEKRAKNITLLPKLDLNELKALISSCDLLIGNDTGPSYIAWANNIPSILLFGPTPTSRIYTDKKTITLKSPSKVDPFRLNRDDFSIKEIEITTILDATKRLL